MPPPSPGSWCCGGPLSTAIRTLFLPGGVRRGAWGCVPALANRSVYRIDRTACRGAVMDQARKRRATARVEGLLERVEHEVLFSEADTRRPTMRRKDVNHKGDGDEADAV